MSTATRVLLVDDHEDSVAMYAVLLDALGLEVTTASTADEALALAEQCCPEAVVVDVCLPGTSGLELARRLRTQEATGTAAILLLTGDARARLSAADVGADRFLLKPLSPLDLRAEIASAVAERRHRLTDAVAEPLAEVSTNDSPA